MRNKTKIVLSTATAFLTGAVWYSARHGTVPVQAAADPTPVAATVTQTPATPAAVAVVAPATPATPSAPVVEADRVGDDGSTNHVARPGDTVGGLAQDILGKDNQTNRDAIVDANSSLKADPDRLLAGKSYTIPSPDRVPAPVPAHVPPAAPAVAEAAPARKPTVLKYTAIDGDTVAKLAAAFLGSDDQAHQDMIVAANPSLQANPDRLIAGSTYRIPAPQGLTAESEPAPAARVAPAATVTTAAQPDSDQIVVDGAPRSLRYTAKPGDTVTTLAIRLLGSDTQEARDKIINNNPSLKQNPDHLVAGQTYSIPAPTATETATTGNQ